MKTHTRTSAGFTLLELLIVIAVLGILLGIAVPTFASYRTSSQLKGGAETVAAVLRQARSAALGSGQAQTVRFASDAAGAYLRVLSVDNSSQTRLPRGIAWGAGTPTSVSMGTDGRASASSYLVVADTRGARDTVSVQLSGLVLLQ